ncbi:hypothetical protein JCM1840_007530 [Sporobolomyces johnsonii]
MLTALHCLSYVASAVGLVFVLLSLASGLLYIAEVIEEHSGLAKTVGQRLVYAIILFFLVLYFVDGLPLQLIAAGILAHLVYLQNFSRNWPTISLTSPTFILSCLCVLVSHYLSFRHFSARQSTAAHHYTHYNAYNHRNTKAGGWDNKNKESFLDVATYFAVCIWLVPFYLFLSLSANDNVLPSAGMPPRPSLSSDLPKPPSSTDQVPSHRPSMLAGNPAAPSPTLSSTPSSPSLSRHTRQRSSMMKSALSSAFSIVPSALRPSTLSSSLAPPGGAGDVRLPRSPSPSVSFGAFAGGGANRGGNSTQREGLLVSSSPTSTGAFFASAQAQAQPRAQWAASQPGSPAAMGGFGGAGGGGGGGIGLGVRHPLQPQMPPRRHTTSGTGDDGLFMDSAAAAMEGRRGSEVVNLGPAPGPSSIARPGIGGAMKRRGPGGDTGSRI